MAGAEVVMKLHLLVIIGFALIATACENKQQAALEQATALAAESMATENQMAGTEGYQYDGILRHMHAHADQLDVLNNALADGNLKAAKLPARWLWRHETLSGVPPDWQLYLVGMRAAARTVEIAPDLESARVASELINEQCQACHAAAGIFSNGVPQVSD
jgi:hypothetical protein